MTRRREVTAVGAIALGIASAAGCGPADSAPREALERPAFARGAGRTVVATGPAPGVDRAASAREWIFEVLDCDRVGAIDSGQVDEHFGELFRPGDVDGSRTLDQREFATALGMAEREAAAEAFARADRNADGVLSADEYREHLYRWIDAADADRDGEASQEEWRAARAAAPES